jgi:predicted acylesterase/phospholipase RssA
LFQAVEIDGEAYWDGGYTGNPALAALVRKMPKCDLIIVRIPIKSSRTAKKIGMPWPQGQTYSRDRDRLPTVRMEPSALRPSC